MDSKEETFGRVVQERMRRRGVTPKELAAVIHRSPSQVSLLLRDKIATPTPDVVAAIAAHLDLSELRLVRLLGYLSTVPESENDAIVSRFAVDDPRRAIAECLAQINQTQADNLLSYLQFIMSASGEVAPME